MQIPSQKIGFSPEERSHILACIDQILSSGKLSQGAYVEELEQSFATYIGTRHALAVSSGSSALELPLRALGIAGREVIVPTNTFMATAQSVFLAGGKVRLADIDPRTFSVSLKELQKVASRETVGVVIVHIGGIIGPDILAIREWCHQEGYWLLEDAAHAHGSALNGCMAGTFGLAAGFSFFATKVMTCGEGGMIVTDDDTIAQQCKLYRNHGKPEPWVSYHTHLGANHRMSEIHAAIALSQLRHLNDIVEARERIARRYTALLAENVPEVQPILPAGRSSWYKYIVLLPQRVERTAIKQYMNIHGIHLAGEVYATPLHHQPVLADLVSSSAASYPVAEDVCQRHICLPLYPDLEEEQILRVVSTLALALHNRK